MMNEKQIYRRMNEAYETLFGDRDEDEWYGDDDPKIWRFYRPFKDLEVKMVMDEENKRITVYKNHKYSGNYSW